MARCSQDSPLKPVRIDAFTYAHELFSRTGNLADLGRFHYAYARERDGVTRVITVWTEADFYVETMFPAEGDAPGVDVEGVPRPPTGRRTLSAHEAGHAQTLTIYVHGSDDVGDLRSFYRSELASRGWQLLADHKHDASQHTLVIERGDRMRVVTMGNDTDGSSYVSIGAAAREPKENDTP